VEIGIETVVGVGVMGVEVGVGAVVDVGVTGVEVGIGIVVDVGVTGMEVVVGTGDKGVAQEVKKRATSRNSFVCFIIIILL
jgi:hypothetical protein